ncbi:MAG: hypothetical protein ABFD03_06180 [Clostridiaceae bacterium]
MDIRFDNEPKKGQTPTTRLNMPNKETEEETERRAETRQSRSKGASRAAEEPHVRVDKPELNPLARIGLILCGFIFSGMVLFTLTGYERISRAYADINSLNSEIELTELRINELEVQIECAVTIQDAQKVAEANGMQYPEKSQYIKIGDPLPFSGSDYPTEPTTDPSAAPTESPAPDTGTGGTGD